MRLTLHDILDFVGIICFIIVVLVCIAAYGGKEDFKNHKFNRKK